MKVKITKYDGKVLFEAEADSLREAVILAVKAKTNLRGADLRGADLRDAYLRDAYLRGAYLRDADLRGADLTGAKNIATKEASTAMLDKIREIVLREPERLIMKDWHGENWDSAKIPEIPGDCGTTHCLAGWAQALSTNLKLRQISTQTAGVILIPTAAHMFFASNERALKFLKDREYA